MGSAAHFIFITGLLLLRPQGPDAGSLLPQIEIWIRGQSPQRATDGDCWSGRVDTRWYQQCLISALSLSLLQDFLKNYLSACPEYQQLASQIPHQPFGLKGDQVDIIDYTTCPCSISSTTLASVTLASQLWLLAR